MISTAWRLLPVLVLPLAPLEAAVDRDRAALGEVLGAVLALRAPDGDVEVVGLVDPLARSASLRRVLHAMRRLQTAVPLGRLRSSGSRVRLPVRTTRLMLVAAIRRSFVLLSAAELRLALARVQADRLERERLAQDLRARCRVFAEPCDVRDVAVREAALLAGVGGGARRRRGSRGPRPPRRSSRSSRSRAPRSVPVVAVGAGGAGAPGLSLMIRKRSTPSVIFRLWSSRSSRRVVVRLELEEVVLRLGPVVDLEGHLALAPVVDADHRAAGVDRLLDVPEDRVAALLRGLRVEQQHEVVERVPCGA